MFNFTTYSRLSTGSKVHNLAINTDFKSLSITVSLFRILFHVCPGSIPFPIASFVIRTFEMPNSDILDKHLPNNEKASWASLLFENAFTLNSLRYASMFSVN